MSIMIYKIFFIQLIPHNQFSLLVIPYMLISSQLVLRRCVKSITATKVSFSFDFPVMLLEETLGTIIRFFYFDFPWSPVSSILIIILSYNLIKIINLTEKSLMLSLVIKSERLCRRKLSSSYYIIQDVLGSTIIQVIYPIILSSQTWKPDDFQI